MREPAGTDDGILDQVLDEIGARYWMTASEVLQHMLIGDVRHDLATADECGTTDPRDGAYWCVRPPGHDGDHCRYTEAELRGVPLLWPERRARRKATP